MNHMQGTKEIFVDCAAKGIAAFDTNLERTATHPQLGVRLAHPDLALEDLRRTRRNLHLVDLEDHAEIVAEFRAATGLEAHLSGEPDGSARAA